MRHNCRIYSKAKQKMQIKIFIQASNIWDIYVEQEEQEILNKKL